MSSTTAAIEPRAATRRDVGLLGGAFVVSAVGDWIYRFAVPALVLASTGSALATALAYAVELIPYTVVGLVSGVLADRFDRRRMLIVCDLVSAGIATILAVTVVVGPPPVWALYGLALALAAVRPCYFPAFQGAVVDLVPARRRSRVNAWTQTTDSILGFAGPALGTALLALIGVPAATAANAASFVVSALLVAAIAARSAAIPSRTRFGPAAFGRELGAGVRLLWSVSALRWGTLLMAGANLAVFVIEPNLIYLLLRVERQSPVSLGLVFGAQGLGAVLGALAAPLLLDRVRPGRVLAAGMGLSAVAMALPLGITLVLAPAPLTITIGLAWAVEGVATSLVVVAWFTLRQQVVPEHVIGRVVAIGRSIAYAAIPLGSVLGGLIAAGPQPARALFGLGCAIQLLVAVATALSPLNRRDLGPVSR